MVFIISSSHLNDRVKKTKTMSKDYCVILAGGTGRRLWPASSKAVPKQFVDVFGIGSTLLQLTYERFARFIEPDHIYVSTYVDYIDIVEEQLPNIPRRHILAEPVRLGTAPAVAWANIHIIYKEPDARVIVTPADQYILRQDVFEQNMSHALDFVARNNVFVVMGVRPTRIATEYGYIQMGGQPDEHNLVPVKSFTEKPDENFARMFIESGEFLWNTGLYLWSAKTMQNSVAELIPNIAPHIDEFINLSREEEQDFVNKHYPSNLYMSIEKAVLERSANVYVGAGAFGWADLGTWSSLYGISDKDENGNVALATRTVMHDCSNNVVKLPSGRVAVIEGLDGYIVAESENTLLICKRGDANRVRLLANEAQEKLGKEFA